MSYRELYYRLYTYIVKHFSEQTNLIRLAIKREVNIYRVLRVLLHCHYIRIWHQDDNLLSRGFHQTNKLKQKKKKKVESFAGS